MRSLYKIPLCNQYDNDSIYYCLFLHTYNFKLNRAYERAYQNLEELNRKAEKGGGDARIEKQHSVGKLTARERIELLLEKVRLSNWTSWLLIVVPISVWRSRSLQETELSPVMA